MKMLLILQIIMASNYREFGIQCFDYIDKQLYEVKERFQSGNLKDVFSDTFMQYLRNKTMKSGITGMERQHIVKRMYAKLDKVEKMSKELKKFSYPLFVDRTESKKTAKRTTVANMTPCLLDLLVNNWEPGNPIYPVCTDHLNYGIPKNLTIVHRYLLPITERGMFDVKPIICDILKKFTHIYKPTSHKPITPIMKPTLSTTTERLTASQEADKRYNDEELYKRFGHFSEYTISDSSKKQGKTFIKENNTLLLHDLSCPIYSDPRSGVKRRKRFTKASDPCNKTTLKPPSKLRRKKYWGPRIYETLKLLNDTKRADKILSEYNEFVLNRGSSFHFGHDTMYESQYDSSSYG